MAPEFRKLEMASGLRIWAKILGLRTGDLEITFEGDKARIVGAASSTKGAFEATVEVPDGFDPERASEEYFNGELRIAVPRL